MYQQGACYMLILTLRQKPIPVLHVCLTLASIQKSTHFYVIRNTSYFVTNRCCLFCLKYFFPFLSTDVKETLNIKDKG